MVNLETDQKDSQEQKAKDLRRYYAGALPLPFPGTLLRGDSGGKVKLLQEFLSLANYNLILDGDFGPATEYALLQYTEEVLGSSFKVKRLTKRAWRMLTSKYRSALRKIQMQQRMNTAVLMYAFKHLQANARELLGMNLGPWVRLYMKGNEGQEFPWCAGFVSFVLKQAFQTYNFELAGADAIPDTFSCDTLAQWGADHRRLVTVIPKDFIIPSGSIFLIHKGAVPYDWIHTGFVITHYEGVIETIEGNTNVVGSREGIQVMRRFRRVKNMHVICNYLPKIPILRRARNVSEI